jgi:chromosome segregation ATPase
MAKKEKLEKGIDYSALTQEELIAKIAELEQAIADKDAIIATITASTSELEEKLLKALGNIAKADEKLSGVIAAIEFRGKRKRPVFKAIRALGRTIILAKELVNLKKNGVLFEDLTDSEKEFVLAAYPSAFEDADDEETLI